MLLKPGQKFRSYLRKIVFRSVLGLNYILCNKSAYWKDWHTVGIERIKDLLDENNSFLGFEQFCRKTGLKSPFIPTLYYGLILAIPYNIQLSPEGEVNSGDYIPRREASSYISTALHRL